MSKQSLRNIHRLIKAATNEMPISQQFVADLKAAIEKQDSLKGRKPSKSYKPSSMTCIRNMYFQVIGAEQDEGRANSCLIGMAQTGSHRHDKLQEAISLMKDFNIDCEYIDIEEFIKIRNLDHLQVVERKGFETKLYHKDLNISFMCDGIIKYKGQYYILEIKTETIYKWQSREGVSPEHIPQGSAYSLSLEVDQVLFLYENRDTCDKKAYVLEITDEMKYDLVLSKIEECDAYVDSLIPPPKPKDITKKDCQYCRYKKECRKAGN